MAEIIWSARSLRDINEIAAFIAKDSLQYAKTQVQLFFEKAKVLEQHPSFGRIIPELNITSIRQVLCGHFRIIYEIMEPDKIVILTVHHQSRLFKNSPAIKRSTKKKGRK
jgi:toxin ParE1/3/4